MKIYLDLLDDILSNGVEKEDRTGTGTLSCFGRQIRIPLDDGFPILTTKKMHLKSIIHELLWFIKGETNIAYLKQHNVRIWDEWATPEGNLGPIYGKQWRAWDSYQNEEPPIDQLATLIHNLNHNPDSRRHVVSAWNVAQLADMKLQPCHCLFQFYVANDKLSCQLYQRSADIFLGVPFNIASYALLTQMIAQICQLGLGDFVHTFGDVHLYKNHIHQAKEQLARSPLDKSKMILNPNITKLEDFTYEDFTLEGYQSHPTIKAPVAV